MNIPAKARLAASLSKLVYAFDFPVSNVWGPERFSLVKIVRHENDVCAVLRDVLRDELWVVFRGTDDLKDIQEDLQCGMDPDRYGYDGDVHSGFADAYAGLLGLGGLGHILTFNSDKLINFTGHSRGAALAGLAAHMHSTFVTDPRYSVYTFGAPRYADFRVMAQLSPNLYAFEISGDLITKVPPTTLGYCSPGVMALSKTNTKFIKPFPTAKTRWYSKVFADFCTIVKMSSFALVPSRFARRLRERHSAAAYEQYVAAALLRQTRANT